MNIRLTQLGSLLALALLLLAGCSAEKTPESKDKPIYYTCTMDTWVRSKQPGKCPKCGMDLVPVFAKETNSSATMPHTHGVTGETMSNTDEAPKEFIVPVARQQMIGVTYASVEKKPLRSEVRAVGTVTYDKQRYWSFVSRVDGYVQKLEVSAPGELVESNQTLLTLYSPDLLSAQREFVDLLRMRDDAAGPQATAARESAERLIASAEQRFKLWDITDEQVSELRKDRKPNETLALHSPFKGVVRNLQAEQGRKVLPGDPLVSIADLSVVWVWAQFYQTDLPLLKKDAPVTIQADAMLENKLTGKIALVDPFIDDATRTMRTRVDVDNPDFKLRPGMYVNILLDVNAGEGLVIPASAVLPTGQHNVVFVDKGEGKLEPRFIELGGKYGDDYAVLSGLQPGERVVSSANFLIDAESKIQGALKSW